MTGLIITIHLIVCALLIIIILIQRGRGGGLAESFSDVESMFGTKTNLFLTRTTTVLSIIFFMTCLSLAILSARQSRSLMKGVKTPAESVKQAPQDKPEQEIPKVEEKAAGEQAQAPQAPKTE